MSTTPQSHRPALPPILIVVGALLVLVVVAFTFAAGWLVAPTTTRFQSDAPMAGQSAGTITIDDAAALIKIAAADQDANLYRATIDYSGSAPRFSYAEGNINIERPSNVVNMLGRPRDVIDLTVSPSVAWSIAINGAGSTITIDLASGQLTAFKFNGAGTSVTIAGGPPHGVVRVSMDGVGSGLTLNLPAGTPYRATADGVGASIVGDAETDGWSAAADRYEVIVNGVGQQATVAAAG